MKRIENQIQDSSLTLAGAWAERQGRSVFQPRVAEGYPGSREREFINPNGVVSSGGRFEPQPRWGSGNGYGIRVPKVGANAPTLGFGPERLWRSFKVPRAARNAARWSIQYWLLPLIVFVFLTGCAVGPNYKPPQTSVAASFANAPTNVPSADEATLATWWKGFNDAKLDGLVDRAIAHNHDLRIATANLKEARALRRLTTFDLAPTVQGNAGYQNGLLSKSAALPGASRGAREFELYDASFDATWELDLFGRVRRSVQAANAQFAATEATRLDVLVSVTAEVARNYLELRGLQNQLAVARRNADVQTETLKITQSRLEGGRGTEFDVSRSRSLLNLTLSTIPPLEAGIQKTIHRLAILIGQQPTALTTALSAPVPLPSVIPPLALSNPEFLLRRR